MIMTTSASYAAGLSAIRRCLYLVVVALQTLQWLAQSKSPVAAGTPAEEVWRAYWHSALAIWAFLMLPLFVTLQSALIAGLEHQERQWKHLLSLPVARHGFYHAKFISLAILVFLAMVVMLAVLIPIGGVILGLRAELGISGWPNFVEMFAKGIRVYLCSLLLFSMSIWIALKWRSFTVAVSVGMSATVMGFIIGQSKDYGGWFPWTMPIQPLTKNPELGLVIAVNFAAATLITVLACVEFERRQFVE
jgi:lantibiotic transport system permease protein